jgi:FtsH-binding integral membrane protein
MYSEISQRTFFSRVFFNMAGALVLTALTAFGVASYPPFIQAIVTNTSGLFILMILEVILVYFLSRRIMTMSVGAAYTGLVGFSLVNGVTLSLIFMVYTLESIYTVFFAAAGLFAVMGLFGYMTKKDLSPIGRFLIMSLFGIITCRWSIYSSAARRSCNYQLYQRVRLLRTDGLRYPGA